MNANAKKCQFQRILMKMTMQIFVVDIDTDAIRIG